MRSVFPLHCIMRCSRVEHILQNFGRDAAERFVAGLEALAFGQFVDGKIRPSAFEKPDDSM